LFLSTSFFVLSGSERHALGGPHRFRTARHDRLRRRGASPIVSGGPIFQRGRSPERGRRSGRFGTGRRCRPCGVRRPMGAPRRVHVAVMVVIVVIVRNVNIHRYGSRRGYDGTVRGSSIADSRSGGDCGRCVRGGTGGSTLGRLGVGWRR
jgi:hypothetical protein